MAEYADYTCEICGRETRARTDYSRYHEKLCMSCTLLITQNQNIVKWWNTLLPTSMKAKQFPSDFPTNVVWDDLSMDQKKEVVRMYIKGTKLESESDLFKTKNTREQDETLRRYK